ncbi:MAG: hypothetical protein NTY09_02190, partial [bacterium]|nr:hypothetical protein [bacterium]
MELEPETRDAVAFIAGKVSMTEGTKTAFSKLNLPENRIIQTYSQMKKNPHEQSTAPSEVLFNTWASRITTGRKWQLAVMIFSLLLLIAWAVIVLTSHGHPDYMGSRLVGHASGSVRFSPGQTGGNDSFLQYSLGIFFLLFAIIRCWLILLPATAVSRDFEPLRWVAIRDTKPGVRNIMSAVRRLAWRYSIFPLTIVTLIESAVIFLAVYRPDYFGYGSVSGIPGILISMISILILGGIVLLLYGYVLTGLAYLGGAISRGRWGAILAVVIPMAIILAPVLKVCFSEPTFTDVMPNYPWMNTRFSLLVPENMMYMLSAGFSMFLFVPFGIFAYCLGVPGLAFWSLFGSVVTLKFGQGLHYADAPISARDAILARWSREFVGLKSRLS